MVKKLIDFYTKFVSVVLIPFLIPTYLCGITLYYFPILVSSNSTADNWVYISGIFIFTVLLPFLLVYLLLVFKKISSLTLYKQEDRFIPQIFTCFSYAAITVFLFYKLTWNNILSLSMLANTASVIVVTVVNRFWKISTHAAGVIGFLTIATMIFLKHPNPDFIPMLTVIAVFCCSVCFARIYLKAHTVGQVIAGSILGILVAAMVFIFLN
jgi:membrane-associated phospholipid phosphatase